MNLGKYVAITVHFAVDSVSTSLVNIKDLAIAKLLNICWCRITEHCGFLVIWYFKVQIDFPCIVNSTYYCCQFLGYYASELFAYCSQSPSSMCFSLGMTPPDWFKLYSASYYLIFTRDTFCFTKLQSYETARHSQADLIFFSTNCSMYSGREVLNITLCLKSKQD